MIIRKVEYIECPVCGAVYESDPSMESKYPPDKVDVLCLECENFNSLDKWRGK